MSRHTPNPNVLVGPGVYRSWDSGIRNSAVHPRGPPQGAHRGGRLPHGIPRLVLLAVVVDGVVTLDARRVHRKLVPGAAIAVGIDHDLDLVRRRPHTATGHQAENAVGVGG